MKKVFLAGLGVFSLIGMGCSADDPSGPPGSGGRRGVAGIDTADGSDSVGGSDARPSDDSGGAAPPGRDGEPRSPDDGMSSDATDRSDARLKPDAGPSYDDSCGKGMLPDASHAPEPVCLAPDVPCDNQGKQALIDRHNAYVAIAKTGNVDFLLLGDFLCDDFRGDGGAFKETKKVYDDAFGQYRPADFCEGGDMTEHVLWRIQNGELDGIQPRVVMLNVGTTNGGRNDSPERILAGIKAIIDYTLEKVPGVKILLTSVVPWGSGVVNARHTSVNKLLPLLDDCGRTVRFVDIYPKFLRPDGSLPMPDSLTRDGGVHLTAAGYEVWADAVAAPLQELMK
jgi:GDSL-like Lipase/Acylhydrolase family